MCRFCRRADDAMAAAERDRKRKVLRTDHCTSVTATMAVDMFFIRRSSWECETDTVIFGRRAKRRRDQDDCCGDHNGTFITTGRQRRTNGTAGEQWERRLHARRVRGCTAEQ